MNKVPKEWSKTSWFKKLDKNQKQSYIKYEKYLGNPHEIEAFAAGIAAKMISNYLLKEYHNRKNSDPITNDFNLNNYINKTIDNLSKEYFCYFHNFNRYKRLYKTCNKKTKTIKKGQYRKVDTLERKVWRIFIKSNLGRKRDYRFSDSMIRSSRNLVL
jgi:hypothetical protein